MVCPALSASGDHDREQRRGSGSGPQKVDCQPSRSHGVDEGEQNRGDEERRHPEPGDEGGVSEAGSLFSACAVALLEGPVGELRCHEQSCRERGRCAVEPRIVDRQLCGVVASDDDDRDGDQRRPSKRERRDESEEPGGCESDFDDLQGVARARDGNRRQRAKARDACDAGRYTRASLA